MDGLIEVCLLFAYCAAVSACLAMWDTDYELARNCYGGMPWWDFMCLEWCDGFEQPSCEV